MRERTITFCDEATGEIHEYVRYSARLDDFNKKYGPETGHRVVSTIGGLLDLQPSRMAAVREAAGNGLRPQDCGLGKLSNMMVCTHRLLNADGDVVCDAHAAMAVTGHKDLECLATASHQRLMAKVGFGGEIFDEDENRDIAATENRGTSEPDEGEDGAQIARRRRNLRPNRMPRQPAPENRGGGPERPGRPHPPPRPRTGPTSRRRGRTRSSLRRTGARPTSPRPRRQSRPHPSPWSGK